MHGPDLILTLTGGFSAALALGFLTHKLGLSPIVGYLLAGLIVGPYTPGFVADGHLAEQFAEMGVVLLMFGVGLHFHLKDLLAVRHIALTGAIVQSLAATAFGALATHFFGWSWAAGIVFGLALSVASTVVLTRVLADHNDMHTRTGRIAVGWLVVEDIFTVLVLVLLPPVFGPDAAGGSGLAIALLVALGKLGALTAFTFLIGNRLIPKLLNMVSATHSRELFTLTVLVLALGIAVGSAHWFGASMALGAFLAGMVVGQSEFSFRAASDALPMRDAFAVLFFVSVGMLFDPAHLMDSPWLVLLTLLVVVIGKPIAAMGIVIALGGGSRVALGTAVALAQIGEFSFILASVGKQMKILPESATNILVAAAIVSITLNPLLYRLVEPMEKALRRKSRWWQALNRSGQDAAEDEIKQPVGSHRAVIVGYGPVGETVCRLLCERGVTPTVIELNLDTVRRLRLENVAVVYGDANQPDVLERAGIATAISMILSAPASPESVEMIKTARNLNPKLEVLARSSYLGEVAGIQLAGASAVFTGEGEVALAMTEHLLRQLGATADQMDRERERVREELSAAWRKPAA